MTPRSEIPPELVDELLALPAREQQTRFLGEKGLSNAEGLDRLLDVADRLARDDPSKARRLAELCAGLADVWNAPAAGPRADYIRVQAYFADGEFDTALRLIHSAHDGYVSLGMFLEALRTNVGRMAVLLEVGLYREALDTGRVVLDALAGRGELDVSPTARETELLTALVFNNSGGCYEYMGRFDDALDAYASAEEKFRSLGMTEDVGQISNNRSAILLQLGRGSEALAAQETAIAIFEEAGLSLRHAQALSSIGETHLELANYTRSLEAFERARRLLEPLDARAEEFYVLRSTADAYLALNLYSEALAAYRKANDLLRTAGMAHDRARALWGMGSALVARFELEEAEKVLEEAAALFAAAGNKPLLSGVMLEQASILEMRGVRDAALEMANRALIHVSGDDRPVQRVYAHIRLADLSLPDASNVETHLMEARRLSRDLTLPHLRYRLDERLGHLRLLQDRSEEARALLESAVEQIEQLRGAVAQDAMRASFLRDKTAAYEDLLLLHLSRDGEESARRAFAVAERAKSRTLVDLLTGVVATKPADPGEPEQEDRLRRLQADLNATYSRLLGGPADEDRGTPLPDLNARAIELEEEIGRIRLQQVSAGVFSVPFAEAEPPGSIEERLPDDAVLLAYHLIGDEVAAFLYAGGRVRVARRLSTVDEVRRLSRRLAVQWDRFRMGREFASRNMAVLERSARQLLNTLYAALIEPLEPMLEEDEELAADGEVRVRRLAIVPHGLLHQIPFHALFDGERYLIERFEVSYAPSATVYALCQKRESRDSGNALVVGVEDPSIPAATAEAHAVAEHLPGAGVRVGDRATMAALREEAPDRATLHLACHGLFRSDNPMFSSLKLRDGWLTAADAMGLDLTGALVVLSACESGRNEVIGGDEVIGLTRGFLGAGAATLVVSLWLVQDETTAEFMGNWYERLRAGGGRAAALRAAQLEIKQRYPHPYYWAPFVLVGKR